MLPKVWRSQSLGIRGQGVEKRFKGQDGGLLAPPPLSPSGGGYLSAVLLMKQVEAEL